MVVNCNLVMLFIGTLDDSSALDFNNSSQVPTPIILKNTIKDFQSVNMILWRCRKCNVLRLAEGHFHFNSVLIFFFIIKYVSFCSSNPESHHILQKLTYCLFGDTEWTHKLILEIGDIFFLCQDP